MLEDRNAILEDSKAILCLKTLPSIYVMRRAALRFKLQLSKLLECRFN